MTDHDLLEPGSHRAAGIADDSALVAAMLRVEVAWMHVLADVGPASSEQRAAVETAAARIGISLDAQTVEDAGNPVLALVGSLRAAVDDPDAADLVHRGLTSQDVLDTALMLVSADALARIGSDLDRMAAALAGFARVHRGSVMAGRTLTQFAVPITFGLKASQWLVGVLDAADAVADVRRSLPVQCGGAAGTLSRAADLVPDPVEAGRLLGTRLGLVWPGLPWHTRRTPVTRLAEALVQTCDALGVIAADVLTLGRPEIAELSEAVVEGRGGSSTMPHKRNPVLSVLVHSAGLQAPQLCAQLHMAAALGVDERAPGAWHAEWPALRRLLRLTVIAASQAAELVHGLEVDAETMSRRANRAAADLLAERGSGHRDGAMDDPASYLGATDAFIDHALHRFAARGAPDA